MVIFYHNTTLTIARGLISRKNFREMALSAQLKLEIIKIFYGNDQSLTRTRRPYHKLSRN